MKIDKEKAYLPPPLSSVINSRCNIYKTVYLHLCGYFITYHGESKLRLYEKLSAKIDLSTPLYIYHVQCFQRKATKNNYENK